MIYPSLENGGRAKRLVAASDAGFTLLEPVIAMLVLMIVAVSVLPVLTQSLIQSVNNAVLASATSLANQAIEDERAQTTCSALTALDQSVTVRPNAVLRTVRTIDTCPAHFPSTVKVSVTVTDVSTGVLEVSLGTLVFVTGA
jgi:type II secretory pathway pseudopilin PulG